MLKPEPLQYVALQHFFLNYFPRPMRTLLTGLLLSCGTSGCAVVAVADAAVTVVATTVKVGAVAVGAVVDVGAAGVRVVTGSGD